MKLLNLTLLTPLLALFPLAALSAPIPCDLTISADKIKGLELIELQWKKDQEVDLSVPFWAVAGVFYYHQIQPESGSESHATHLEETFDISHGSAMRYMGQLLQAGWVQTLPRPQDGRKKRLVVTEKGLEEFNRFMYSLGLTHRQIIGLFENLKAEKDLIGGNLGVLVFLHSQLVRRLPTETVIFHMELSFSRFQMERNLDISMGVFRRAFKSLVENGWISIQPLPADPRKKQVSLNPQSLDLLRSLISEM